MAPPTAPRNKNGDERRKFHQVKFQAEKNQPTISPGEIVKKKCVAPETEHQGAKKEARKARTDTKKEGPEAKKGPTAPRS